MKRKNMTKFDKAVSAAFTGHRFYNFSQQEVIRERLTKAILEAYEHGISNEPTLKSKACLKCLYFTKIISALCCYLEYFSYLYTIN